MFQKARAVFLNGLSHEMNVFAGFGTVLQLNETENVTINVACCDYYKLYINGYMSSYGPAASANGFYRMDTIDISSKLKKGSNTVVFIVAGYHTDSVKNSKRESFLQVEIIQKDKVLSATGYDFKAYKIPWHCRKVLRYSKSRQFTEVWQLDSGFYDLINLRAVNSEEPEILEDKSVIQRSTYYPEYKKREGNLFASGKADNLYDPMFSISGNEFYKPSAKFKSFKPEELECNITEEVSHIQTLSYDAGVTDNVIRMWDFKVYNFECAVSGFIGINLNVITDTVLYLIFDDRLIRGDINPFRYYCPNAIKLKLKPGMYNFESFEPYSLRYLKIISSEGMVEINNVYVRELSNSVSEIKTFHCPDERINKIYRAAVNTFRYNCIDILMCNPSKDRTGRLYDSYFAAMAEYTLTGQNIIEHDYLENFLMEEKIYKINYYEDEESGSDTSDKMKQYEPFMWLIIELCEYQKRTGDISLALNYKDKIFSAAKHLAKYENDDFLLCDKSMESDNGKETINYQVNMLYCAMIDSLSSLYNDKNLSQKADCLRNAILEKSYKNGLFLDNSFDTKSSEKSQYFALLCNAASKQKTPELIEQLAINYNQNYRNQKVWSNIEKDKEPITFFLRLHLLSREGYGKSMIKELYERYIDIVDKTSTLWESTDDSANCCQGYASYAASLITKEC